MSEQDKNAQDIDPRFHRLLQMLGMMAIQQLGGMPDPESGESVVNLEAAQAMIDLIECLEEKTKGHLSGAQAEFLADTLTKLRLGYVQQQRLTNQSSPAPHDDTPAAASSQPLPDHPEQPAMTIPKQEGERVRYHKSYG